MRPALPNLAVVVLAAVLPAAAAAQATIEVGGGFFLAAGDPATAFITYPTNCFRTHEVEVVPRGAGLLARVTAVEGCACPAGPSVPFQFSAELGPFPAGVHRVELLVASREEGSSLPCAPPVVRATADFAVGTSGSVTAVSTEPAAPRPGQSTALVIESICGFLVWGAPEISGPPNERVIRVAPVPPAAALAGLAPRLTPCGADAHQVIPLGRLAAGIHRVVLLRGDGMTDLEHRIVVAPEAGPPLLLHDGRFRVRGTWRDAQGGFGSAQPGTLTGATGYHWFFDPANVETLVKVLDGCALNGRFWVFLAGLTDVETHLTVEDTLTGQVWSHTNRLRTPFAPVQDTNALTGCSGGE
ncbi:MAG TPA: hypothetical protein VEG34_10065 [Thermoanaerobaculia bacterium]|nr:hypothetical protein [Thermoanaerobaculia bacterium]